MIFTSPPPSGPALRAWTIFSIVLGDVLELRLVQGDRGDPAGFWRVRFSDQDTGKERVRDVPVRNLENVSDDQIQKIRVLRRKVATLQRQAAASKNGILRMKLAGADEEPRPLTAEIVRDHRRGKTARRVRIRKRPPGEGPSAVR